MPENVDPFAEIAPGEMSPFVSSARTVNAAMERLRGLPDPRKPIPVGAGIDQRQPPQGVSVLVRNDTGSSLDAFQVVKISTPSQSISEQPHEINRLAVLAGSTPSDAADAFAITQEPISPAGIGRATVLGVCICYVVVNSNAHGYASPGSSTSALESAETGPAKIVYKAGSSGTVLAVVLLQGNMFSGVQALLSGGTDNHLARWHSTGAVIQDSAVELDDDGNMSAVNTLSATGGVVVITTGTGSVGVDDQTVPHTLHIYNNLTLPDASGSYMGLLYKNSTRLLFEASGGVGRVILSGSALSHAYAIWDGSAVADGVTGTLGPGMAATGGIITDAGSGSFFTQADADALYQPLDTQLTSLAGLSYTGNGGKFIRVNAGESGFELADVSGGVSDGDKGDITVSGSGATWTIDNDVVTYAKMQDISAQYRLLGRNSSGAGDPEEVQISQALDWLSPLMIAQGDILYRGLSSWQTLSAGTSGQFLKTQGAGSVPVWDTVTATVADGDYGDITVSGSGLTWTIDNDVVSNAKLRDSAALSVIGRSANSIGDPADITAGSDGAVLRRSGTTLDFGTVATAGIADDAVTYAKMQNVSAGSRILGRNSGAGDPEELTLSQTLDFVGSAANGDILYRTGGSWTRTALASVAGVQAGVSYVATEETTTSTSTTDLGTVQSVDVVSDGGIYLIEAEANVGNTVSSALCYLVVDIDGSDTDVAVTSITDTAAGTGPIRQTLSGSLRTTLTAGTRTIKLQFRTNAGTVRFGKRKIRITKS